VKIAQVAPLFESVPPVLYGGTERIVSYLTEELIEQGHEVTLFASGDSDTQAKLVPICDRALRLSPRPVDPFVYQTLLLERVFEQCEQFDFVHFHIDYFHFPLSRRLPINQLTTFHGRLDLPDLPVIFREFNDMPLSSISFAQRRPVRWANWVSNVYHGLPVDKYRGELTQGSYLAFVGRISPEKRADRAIAIAIRAGMPIKIAAKVDKVDKDYYEQKIKPLLNHPLVEFVGEISDAEKNALLGEAYALLFPIDWPEPFGLVMIESMACGTPVIAYSQGSVPEIIDEGQTGFVVADEAEAVKALRKVERFDRAQCRRIFEKRFSASRMAHDYTSVYTRLLTNEHASKIAS
jgi:glycosyltransferase involved in cell wall biosynthesis